MGLPQQYTSLYRSTYNNRVDNFEIVIYGLFTQTEQEIQATAVLSYKDVDNILDPIRGAQLDIEIDASLDNDFDLFLDFNENDFIAELYRNGDLLFQGYINPEGVAQSYVNINWKIKLVAVDNISNLKNIAFDYNQELPTEFVLLDKCLKKTGLDLPIAVYDDINRRRILNGTNDNWGATFDNMYYDRIINPDVFKNENGRYVSCKDVVTDILQKYNAILKQESIWHLDLSDNTYKYRLCWLFYRPALLSFPFFGNPFFKIKKITGFTENPSQEQGFDKLYFAPIFENIGLFLNVTKRIGTVGQSNIDAIHKNANQLIRANRGLQNFRFVQNWKNKGDILELFPENYILGLGSSESGNNYIIDHSPSLPFENYLLRKKIKIKTPNLNTNILFKDTVEYTKTFNETPTNPIPDFLFLRYKFLYTEANGNVKVLTSTGNFFNIPPEGYFWEDYNPGSDSDITTGQYSVLYTFPNNADIGVITSFTPDDLVIQENMFYIPPFPSVGGELEVFVRNISTSSVLGVRARIINASLEYEKRLDFGKGEYHDALNQQKVTSNLSDPVDVINADETTNLFLNGLQQVDLSQSPLKIRNYPYWTTWYNTSTTTPRLLQLMSIERLRMFSKSLRVFNGDIHGYIPYFSNLKNTAFGNSSFAFTKWKYDTANNTIEAESREIGIRAPSVNYERSFIFEDETNRLIE